jgi:hypothetical protein
MVKNEIMRALQSGAIDATEWIGPWLDMSIGLSENLTPVLEPIDERPSDEKGSSLRGCAIGGDHFRGI